MKKLHIALESSSMTAYEVFDAFPGRNISAVKVTVPETWGKPSARVFEV
jgi:hypothetical protein